MLSSWLLSAWALALTAVPVGTELQYSGKLQKTDDAGPVEKSFTLTITKAAADRDLFLIEERGGPGWNWPQRFGQFQLSAADSKAIRLLYSFDGTPTPLPVRSPVFGAVDQLTADNEWNESGGQYVCLGTRTVNQREVAIVEAAFDRGRRQRLEIDPQTGVIQSLKERLFLGRGDPFVLTMQLDSQKNLSAAELTALNQISQPLVALQAELPLPDSQHRSLLEPTQIQRVEQELAKLTADNESNWGRLVTSIQRDLAAQTRRLQGVSGLAEKYLGQTIEVTADWRQLDGETLPRGQWQGHTTVLHFWPYDGEKLIEPYGQVGYLDFLNNRRKRLGVHVIGIAVDSRFSDPATAKLASRSIRKFREFMNLGFPIVTDDGKVLAQFGDPRTIGAELPLWIVIGHDGKITHYHVGYYSLEPDQGLQQLDAAVIDALKREKAAIRGQ